MTNTRYGYILERKSLKGLSLYEDKLPLCSVPSLLLMHVIFS